MKIAYLISPFYQVQDNNGLTVAGAQIFVYQAGTTNPANTFKNFNGALNTWPVLTDTLGNATVLADISKTYDVLIKDQNGNLLMSKQNMVPGGAGEGGGSITPVEPIDQQHWIGLNGSSTAVSADLVGTILHLPDASDEYQAFIESNRNDHIILSDGLYLVHAVIDIKQDSDALENTIENLTVMTGVADPEDVIFERDEAGHDASDNVHSLKLSFIRHAQALEGTNELFFRIISAVNLTSAAIRRLSIVKLQTSGYGSDPQPIPSDVSAYATSAWVDENFLRQADYHEYSAGNDYIRIDEYKVYGYDWTSAVSAVPFKLDTSSFEQYSAWADDTYLKEDALEGYATEEYVTEHTSAFVDSAYVSEYVTSQTSGKQDTLTFEYNADSAISAINGSAIAGGGDTGIVVFEVSYSESIADFVYPTYREVADAVSAGKMPVILRYEHNSPVRHCFVFRWLSGGYAHFDNDIQYVEISSQNVVETGYINDKNLAADYDPTATYGVGDYCIYHNELFVCITDILVAEEFNLFHWRRTRMSDIVGNVETLLAAL